MLGPMTAWEELAEVPGTAGIRMVLRPLSRQKMVFPWPRSEPPGRESGPVVILEWTLPKAGKPLQKRRLERNPRHNAEGACQQPAELSFAEVWQALL